MTIVWAGLSVGAIYALIAIGFNITMTFGGVFNFAFGATLILGGFGAWFFIVERGWPWWAAAALGLLLGSLIGTATELVAVRPVLASNNPHALLITTVGAAVLIEGLLMATWGKIPRSVPFFGGDDAFTFLGGRVAPNGIWLIGCALALGGGLHVVARRSLWGIEARAATTDPDAAKARGVNVPRLRTLSFAVAGALAGLLGPIIVPKTGATVSVTMTLTVFGFVALALGGFGSFLGSVLAGLLVGLVEAFGSRYLSVDYPPILLFGLLLLVLLIRPTGLFGRPSMRVV